MWYRLKLSKFQKTVNQGSVVPRQIKKYPQDVGKLDFLFNESKKFIKQNKCINCLNLVVYGWDGQFKKKNTSNIVRKVVGSNNDVGVCGDYYFQAVWNIDH